MNKVVLVGRLTRDPEMRYTSSAEPVAVVNYTVAVDRRFKAEGQPDADFIPCLVFGKQAEFAAKYFKKGMMVSVSGRIQISSWDDQNGQKRWKTEVLIEDQEFAESKSSFENRMGRTQNSDYQSAAPSIPRPSTSGFTPIEENIDDEDLPF